MTKVAEWILQCSNDGCGADVFRSVPLPQPKVGDRLAYQQWYHMDGSPTHLGYPFFCGTCCKEFMPLVNFLKMHRYIGDDQYV